jgi:hypothetical protein
MYEKKFIKCMLCFVLILCFSITAGVRGANILFISVMDDPPVLQPSDDALKAFLESLGHTVTYLDDDTPKLDMATAAAAADVVFISESPGSAKVHSKINEITTPMVVSEAWAWDQMGLATLTPGATAEGIAVSTTDIEIVAPGHPLAAGLTGTVPVLTAITGPRGTARFSTDTPGSKATVIARATLSDGSTYDIIFVYEKGAELALLPADGTPNKAAGIRVCLGFDEQSYLSWNENAYKLFEAAINFALGIRFQPQPYSPFPANGQADVPRDTDLSWHPGMYAGKSNVYLGTDFNDVNQASVDNPRSMLVVQNKTDAAYDPGILDYGKTYYWRVDEVNSTPDFTVHKGDIWSFTVVNFIIVDDFEDYNDYQPHRIFDTWKDGFGTTTNGATVGYPDPCFARFEHFVETSIINSGEQSMPYFYDNNMKYSEAFRPLDGAEQNLTRDGVATLSLCFKGYPKYVGYFLEQPASTYTLRGAGTDIWSNADEFHFAYKEVASGVCTIIAKVERYDPINKDAKAGIMIRDSLDPGSINTALLLTPDPTKGLRFQNRYTTNGNTERPTADGDPNATSGPYWLKLERTAGGLVRAYRSPDPATVPYKQFALKTMSMQFPIYIGLAVTSHDVTQVCEAVFSNVSFPNNAALAAQQWKDADIGIKSNVTEPMYVALSGAGKTVVVYHDDPNAVNIKDWTEWPIPLQRFADQGLNLSNVEKLAIGFGTKGDMTKPGGAGKMFFDDIRLYRPPVK